MERLADFRPPDAPPLTGQTIQHECEGNAVHGAKNALPLLNDGGSIILNGSVASVKGTPAFCVYGASKAAIRSFVRTWTTDLKDRRIRSNVVSPGPINTARWRVSNRQT
jgi:NAD(P)-dependent dehydrogenase (short-subunit alcohol dehydrogenase family)